MSRLRLVRGGLLVLTAAIALLTLHPGLAQPAKGKKYALLVGVDYYAHSGLKPLQGAENDVEELAKVLRKQGFDVRLLTTARGRKKDADAPTAANLRKELDKLLDDKTRDDTVLIALAGHGAEVEVPHPDDKEKDEKDKRHKSYTYFFPTDGNLKQISYSTGHSERLLELGGLFDRLGTGPRKCGAGAKLVLIDACRDLAEAESSTRTSSLSPTHVKVPLGVSALFSCGPGQAALELPFDVGEEDYRRHGVFFYHVIEGLKGAAANRRGKINWSDLTSYVQDEVPPYLKRLKLKKRQNPHAVLNAQLPVVLVEGLAVEDGKKERPRDEKVVPAGKAVVSSIGMKLVPIPKGTFTMGAPKAEIDEFFRRWGRVYPNGQHVVELSRGFHLGEKEVTQEEYEKVMGKNPSWFSAAFGGKDKVAGMDTSQFPVEMVSWEEAMEFCSKLTELDRNAGTIGRAKKYRLPTEAEWEYACRGGAPSYQIFHYGNSLSSTQANIDGNSPYGVAAKGPWLQRTCKVGSYKPNAWGLYDMHGNLWEWCLDWYSEDYYKKSPRVDPAGPSSGTQRVLRGGTWSSPGESCRSADRFLCPPGVADQYRGFRVALVPTGE